MKKQLLLTCAALLTSVQAWAAVPIWDGDLTKTDKTIVASWLDNGNPAGTRYRLEVSTRSDFEPGTIVSSTTARLTATIDGLRGNYEYYVRVLALDPDPSAYADPVRTITTLASVPAKLIPGETFVPDPTGITVRWLSNENQDGTTYRVEAFSDAARTQPAGSGQTTNTSLRIDNLSPNKPYWFTVQAANINPSEPGWSPLFVAGSTYTLPGDYSLTSSPNPSDAIWYGQNNSAITFMTDGFTSGHVAYYRYRWDQSSDYTWPVDALQNEITTKFEPVNVHLVVPNTANGQYFLHIKAYNAAGQSNGTASEKVLGRFKIDVTAPDPDDPAVVDLRQIILAPTQITWVTYIASPDDAPMHSTPYGWTFNGGIEEFNVSETSVTANLQANTVYTMSVRARDNADSPNFSHALTSDTVTLQNKPSGVQILDFSANNVRVQINGNFPNMALGDSGLQVRVTDGNEEVLSTIQKASNILVEGLTANAVYDVMARSYNQKGIESAWSTPVRIVTAGGSSAVSAYADAARTVELTADNPPASIGKYPGGTTAYFKDDGAFARQDVAYYKMITSEDAAKPGTVRFRNAERISAGQWEKIFFDSEEPYAHIQSYAAAIGTNEQPITGGYVRLGPWIIDADKPLHQGGSKILVDSPTQITLIAGTAVDIGQSGLHTDPYSFDGGNTFQNGNSVTRSGLEANSPQTVDIVFRDYVGNKSDPVHLSTYTQQNAPTGVELVSKNGKQVVVRVLGNFPRSEVNNSGFQFGTLEANGTVDWWTSPHKLNEETHNFANYNETYRVVARAYNANGVPTDRSPELIVNTNPTIPAISPILGTVVAEWKGTPTFEFKTSELPGPNRFHHYLYAWSMNETHTFDGTEPTWIPNQLTDVLTLTANAAGKWYLHVRTVSALGEQSATQTLGWFGYDNEVPANVALETPIVGINSINWIAAIATDTKVGLHHTDAYLWSLDNGPAETTPHVAPEKAHLITPDLHPNTEHTMSLRVQDALGNIDIVSVGKSAHTLAAPPVAFPITTAFNVTKISARVAFRDGGNPNGTRFLVELSDYPDFFALNESPIEIIRNNPVDGVLTAEFGVGATQLTPNTTYFVRARAFNQADVPTAWVHLGTVTTRPLAPSVVVTPGVGVYALQTAFSAERVNQEPFGQGSIEFMRWVWHTSPGAYSWSVLDNRIDAQNPTISVTASLAGTYYLHVAAYSGGITPNQTPETQVVGPFSILSPTGTDPLIVAINKTDTTITVSQAPLPGINDYGFQLDNGTIEWGNNPNHTFTGRTPNTMYRVNAYIKDGAGTEKGPATQDVTTKQTAPTQIQVTNISTTNALLTAVGTFANVGSPNTAFYFTLRSIYAPVTSGWISQESWQIPMHQLHPNTPYTVTVRTRNSAGEDDGVEAALTAFTTLSIFPNDLNVKPEGHAPLAYFTLPKRFYFDSDANWGQGFIEYIRAITTNDATPPALTEFDDITKATTWVANTKYSTAPINAGTYYMHFRSYNSVNEGGDVYTYGPVYIDNQPPLPNPPALEQVEVFHDKIIWTAVQATDVGGAGLHSEAYHFQYGTSTTAEQVWRGRVYEQRGTFPLTMLPNTTYHITLVVRDALDNRTNVLRVSTMTLAELPFPDPASLVVDATSATFKWDRMKNSALTRYEIGAFFSAADITSDSPALVSDMGLDASSGTIYNLNINTVYWFAVRAINHYGHKTAWATDPSMTKQTKNEIVAPHIREPLTMAVDHAIMEWDDFNNAGTVFEVSQDEVTLPGELTVRVKQFDNLTPNTTYTFGVRAKNASGIFSAFAKAVAVTLANVPTGGSLTINRVSADVSWTNNGNPDVTKYEARASTAATMDGRDDVSLFTTALSGAITGLTPDKFYYVKVRAINHAGKPTAWLTLGEGHTGVQPPQEPYLFTSTTTTSFRLSWGSGGNPAHIDYHIERSLLEDFSDTPVTVVTKELFLLAENLSYNTTYYFRGKGIGLLSESPVVPMGSIVTYATNPVAGLLTSTMDSIHVTWGANSNPAETVYFVETAGNPAFLNRVRSDNVIGTETTLTGLAQNTTYYVRIWAVNHQGTVSQFSANNGNVVTKAAKPVVAVLRAKWNATLGNFVSVNINAGDLNPQHTEYAIFNVNDNGYLTGDAQGTLSPTPVWMRRDDWNTTQTHPNGRGLHGHLLARTEYRYKVRARDHAHIESDFSDEHPVLTVPGKPNLTVTAAENDYALLKWDALDADAFRAYVSLTGTPGSFKRYHDFVDQSVHHIKEEGDDDIPNSLSETRHDTQGGTPAQMTALQFNQLQDATEDSLTFRWNPVGDPTAAPRFWYYLTGLGGFAEEGEPSDTFDVRVQPVIKNYVISGDKTAEIIDNAYEFVAPAGNEVTIPALGPNTRLHVQVKARSSDDVNGAPSPFIDAWTKANVPGRPTVLAAFNVSHHIYTSVRIEPNGNPAHTRYAIYWVEGNAFVTGGGGAIGTSVTDTNTAWLTKEQWDTGFTHTGLESSKTYSYQVYARNGAQTGPHQVTAPSEAGSAQTITFPAPTDLSGVGHNEGVRWRWYDNATDEIRFEVAAPNDMDVARATRDMSVPQNATGFLETIEINSTFNTPITRVVRAVNHNGYSLPSVEAIAWTLAAVPQVRSVSHTEGNSADESGSLNFHFVSDLPFGEGTAAYYRVKFTTQENHTFAGDEETWTDHTREKTFRADVDQELPNGTPEEKAHTRWYIHVLSYNQANTPSKQIKRGPYRIFQDVVPPEIQEVRQDGAESISGAREPSALAGMLSTNSMRTKNVPQLDASFASGVPWAPTVQSVHVRLSKDLDPMTITNNTVLVYAIQNNLSQAITPVKMNYVLSYACQPNPLPCNESDRELHISFPQPGLPAGHLFEVRITNGVKDEAGNSLSGEFSYFFRTFLDPNVTNEVITMAPNGQLSMRLHLPAGSLPEVGAIGIETDPGAYPWGFDNASRQKASQKQLSIGGAFAAPLTERFIGHFNNKHARTAGKLRSGALLSMPYVDADNDGFVDPMPGIAKIGQDIKVKVSNLAIYRFDESTQLWIKVPGSHIDEQNKMIVAVTYDVGVFAVIGTASTDVGASYAYPVPFVYANHQSQGITFTNLPDTGQIKIYTVAGELVKEIQFSPADSGVKNWNVRNDSGQEVGADVYMYRITSGSNKKMGKIVIVR